MAIYLIPLADILTDPDHPLDLTALPEAEAIERIKDTYGYWGALIDVRIREGVAVIELPDENADRAGAALDKIAQAAKLGRTGRYQAAIGLYQEALNVLPRHTGARRELAMAQVEIGDIKGAKQNLIRVLQLDPKDAWAYLILGNLYFKYENDLGSAERYYASAADLDPNDLYILNSYANLMVERGRSDEARELFERAIAAAPDNINPYLGLANLASSQGNVDSALAALDRLFDLPQDADARSQEVYGKARALYADSIGHRAEQHEQAAHTAVQTALDAYTVRTGTQIRVRQDPALKTDALVKLAWRYDRPYHEIMVAGGGQIQY